MSFSAPLFCAVCAAIFPLLLKKNGTSSHGSDKDSSLKHFQSRNWSEPRTKMSQLVSWLLSSLGNILPFQSDTAPSKCPYIVNRDKEGEYICGVMSQSGLLCAKHKNRRPQVHYSDKEAEEEEEEEEETPPT